MIGCSDYCRNNEHSRAPTRSRTSGCAFCRTQIFLPKFLVIYAKCQSILLSEDLFMFKMLSLTIKSSENFFFAFASPFVFDSSS